MEKLTKIDLTSKSHPLQEIRTQLLRKEARGGEPKRRSWWRGRRDTLGLPESQIREERFDCREPFCVRTLLR